MVTPVEEAILATVAYAHLFNYPLTIVELKRWLLKYPSGAASLDDLEKILHESEWLQSRVFYVDGFVFLRGCEAVDKEARAFGYRLTQQKLQHALRVARLFSLFPFVRGIGVANRVSWGCARESSDIDLVVVGAPGRLWLTRFLVTGCAALFGWRPRAGENANTICLSFYVAEDGLNLGDMRFQDNDIHFAFWVYQMLPLYDECKVFERLIKENAKWLNDFFTNAVEYGGAARTVPVRGAWFKKVIELFFAGQWGGFVERVTRRLQEKKIQNRRATEQVPYESAVICTDSVIKLHWNDRRLLYYTQWRRAVDEAHGEGT